MTSTNITRLNTAITQLEDLQAEFAKYKAESDSKMNILRVLIMQNSGVIKELHERVKFLEGELNIVEDDGDPATLVQVVGTAQPVSRATTAEPHVGDGQQEDGAGKDDKEELEAAAIASEEAKKSKPIKVSINCVYQKSETDLHPFAGNLRTL